MQIRCKLRLNNFKGNIQKLDKKFEENKEFIRNPPLQNSHLTDIIQQ